MSVLENTLYLPFHHPRLVAAALREHNLPMYREICKNGVAIDYLRVPIQGPAMIPEWTRDKSVVSSGSLHQELEMAYPDQN